MSDTSHIRAGGVTGGRNMNREDRFEVAVAAAAGTRIIEDDNDAADVWGAITNLDWEHHDGTRAAFSFRAAGDLVAAIRGTGDYMDWYCSTSPGTVPDWFRDEMGFEGWHPA